MDDPLPVFLEKCTLNAPRNISEALLNLRSAAIPPAHPNVHGDIEVIERAIGSLHILHSSMIASSYHHSQPNRQGDIPALVHSAWKDIWRWMVFLDTRCITKKMYGETIMCVSLRAIPRTIRSLGWFADLRLSVIRTPGLIAMLTQHWLNENEYIKEPGLPWDQRYFALALEHLLTYGTDGQHKTDDEVVESIVRATEGGAVIVVRVALQQFDTMLSSEVTDFEVASLFLTLIHKISLSHSVLRPTFLHQGVIPSIARFLRHLPPLPRDHIPSPFDRCISAVAANLLTFTQTMNGPHFAVRALNHGLLAAFILSWPWIQRIQIDRDCGASLLSAGFFGILEDYLVYRSVLRSVDKALKVVEGMDILVHACEAWVAFQQVASARLHLKEEFDAQSDSRLDRGFFGCAYHDCHLRSDQIKYRLCSGCYNDVYCSAACQRADWHKHRTSCKSWQKSLRDGSDIQISQHDRHFLHYLATCHFYSNIHSFKACIESSYRSTPISSPCILMSYLGKFSMQVAVVSTFPWGDEDEKAEMEDLVHRAEAAEGRHISAKVFVRKGCSVQSTVVRTFPLLLLLPPNWLEG